MIEFKKSNSEIEILTKHIDFKDQVIIDVGCGIGKLARLLSKNAKCIYGIDTPELIKKAEEFENPNNVFFKIGLGQSLPIEDNCADIVLFFASFHHIHEEEMSNAIKESSRVLKQNGIVCFLEPYAQVGSYYDLSRLVDDD